MSLGNLKAGLNGVVHIEGLVGPQPDAAAGGVHAHDANAVFLSSDQSSNTAAVLVCDVTGERDDVAVLVVIKVLVEQSVSAHGLEFGGDDSVLVRHGKGGAADSSAVHVDGIELVALGGGGGHVDRSAVGVLFVRINVQRHGAVDRLARGHGEAVFLNGKVVPVTRTLGGVTTVGLNGDIGTRRGSHTGKLLITQQGAGIVVHLGTQGSLSPIHIDLHGVPVVGFEVGFSNQSFCCSI